VAGEPAAPPAAAAAVACGGHRSMTGMHDSPSSRAKPTSSVVREQTPRRGLALLGVAGRLKPPIRCPGALQGADKERRASDGQPNEMRFGAAERLCSVVLHSHGAHLQLGPLLRSSRGDWPGIAGWLSLAALGCPGPSAGCAPIVAVGRARAGREPSARGRLQPLALFHTAPRQDQLALGVGRLRLTERAFTKRGMCISCRMAPHHAVLCSPPFPGLAPPPMPWRSEEQVASSSREGLANSPLTLTGHLSQKRPASHCSAPNLPTALLELFERAAGPSATVRPTRLTCIFPQPSFLTALSAWQQSVG
jgi:hypothetical protein